MKGSSNVETTIERVNEHLRGNRLSEAITVLTEALQVEQQNYDLIYLLGICYIFDSNYEEAISIFEDMLRARPKKNIYLLLSVCYKKTERYEQTESIVTLVTFSSSSASPGSPNTTRPTSTAGNSTSNSNSSNLPSRISIGRSGSTTRSRLRSWGRGTVCG